MNRDVFAVMLAELSERRLEVVLAPAPDPQHSDHCIRVCANRNPDWYRRLCNAHLSGRRRRSLKPDTRIRRRDVENILSRLADGLPAKGYIARELIRIARSLCVSSSGQCASTHKCQSDESGGLTLRPAGSQETESRQLLAPSVA